LEAEGNIDHKIKKWEINMTMFDYFWQVVVGNHASPLTSMTFDWFGYEGEICPFDRYV
jgi:hypothetical protein